MDKMTEGRAKRAAEEARRQRDALLRGAVDGWRPHLEGERNIHPEAAVTWINKFIREAAILFDAPVKERP